MTHYKSLIDTNYLGQWDLPPGRDVPVIIKSVERYKPEVERTKKMPDGSRVKVPNKRILIHFQGKKKGWLAGPVSQEAISGMYGPQFENWIGKAITLWVDPNVKMSGIVTGGVRVRPRAPSGPPTNDPLDRPVDPEVAQRIADAKEEAGNG